MREVVVIQSDQGDEWIGPGMAYVTLVDDRLRAVRRPDPAT